MIDAYISEKVKITENYIVADENSKIRLDANENPYDIPDEMKSDIANAIRQINFNYYPDSDCTTLKKALASYTGVYQESVLVGNGSDELIHICLQCFVNPRDGVLIHTPTFAMYKYYAEMCSGKVIEFETDDCFTLDIKAFINKAVSENPKVIILCSPNNPTGKTVALCDIELILSTCKCVLILDEAYYEFAKSTAQDLLYKYPNLIILRTLSKAVGLAALRIGYLLCHPDMMPYLQKVKPPYNVNGLSQAAAIVVLSHLTKNKNPIDKVIEERHRMQSALKNIHKMTAFESHGNFILIRTLYCDDLYNTLFKHGIRVKRFGSQKLKNCLRITVGKPEENNKILNILEVICNGKC